MAIKLPRALPKEVGEFTTLTGVPGGIPGIYCAQPASPVRKSVPAGRAAAQHAQLPGSENFKPVNCSCLSMVSIWARAAWLI